MGALNWSEEITKHNQHLFKESEAKNKKWNDTKDNVKPLFPLVPASEMTANPMHTNWLVRNILERGSVNLLFGEPAAGKSLFGLDWAFCIAAGIDWEGRTTIQTDVVIIAGEGFAGMQRRLKALEIKYNQPAPARLFISKSPAQMLDATNVQWVADTIADTCPNAGLIIIDTLHRNMDGDENSSQDIGKFVNNLDMYFKPLGAAVLVVHHSGHGEKQRSRGSSSIKAAMDGEFCVTKNGEAVKFSCTKAKDFVAGKDLQFVIKQVDLDWLDDEQEPVTSVYLEYMGEALPIEKTAKLTVRDINILTSLRCAINENGSVPNEEIKTKFKNDFNYLNPAKVILIEDWRPIAYKSIDSDAKTDDAKRMALKRCRDKLLKCNKTREYDGFIWQIC